MARTPQDIPDAELAVLQSRGRAAPATCALTERLCEKATQSLRDRASYLTGSKRKAASSATVNLAHQYRAAVVRADVIGNRLQATADKLCDGALSPLLTHLVRASKLSAAERQSLRQLLDELDSASGKRNK